MGTEINLYPVRRAQKIGEIEDIKIEVDKVRDSGAYLYKCYHELLAILQNESDPYENEDTLAYKAIMGNLVEAEHVSHYVGFVPADEVQAINDWLHKLNINSLEDFENLYNNCSEETKEELINTDSADWENTYHYAKILLKIYAYAAQNDNAIIVLAE